MLWKSRKFCSKMSRFVFLRPPLFAALLTLFLFGDLSAGTQEVKPGESINAKLSALQPGDTLLVRGGTYAEALSLPRSGAAGKPIVLQAYPGEKPVIAVSGTMLNADQDYWVIRGLIFDHLGGASDAVKIRGRFITLSHCELRNGKRDAIDGASSSSDITIENCTIHDFVWNIDNDAHGIVLNPGAARWKIVNNTIYNCGGDAIQLYASDKTEISDYSKDIIISGNILYTTLGINSENALDFKGVDGCLVDGNEMYGFENKAWVTQKGCRNITGSNNFIHDSQRGIEFRGEGGKSQMNIRLVRNVIYNIRQYYAVKFDDVANVEILHNTLANITAKSFRIEGEGLRGGVMRNNLIYNSGSVAVSGPFNCQVGHNGWFNAKAKAMHGEGDVTGSDPLFKNAAQANFELQASSPARDAGVNLGQPFVGNNPDLGAFEFGVATSAGQSGDLTIAFDSPSKFALHQNFPNPFSLNDTRQSTSGGSKLVFDLGEPAQVNLSIYNLSGQKVKTLKDSPAAAGRYVMAWDGRDQTGAPVAAGTYICRMTVRNRDTFVWTEAKRMTVIR